MTTTDTPTYDELKAVYEASKLEMMFSFDEDECKCEAGHEESTCTYSVVARVIYCKGGFLACSGGVDILKRKMDNFCKCWYCGDRGKDCWKIIPV